MFSFAMAIFFRKWKWNHFASLISSHLVLVLSWMSSLCFIILLSFHFCWSRMKKSTSILYFLPLESRTKEKLDIIPSLQGCLDAFCSINARSQPGANPMKQLLVEIHCILGVNSTSKIYSSNFTHILRAISAKNTFKSCGIGLVFWKLIKFTLNLRA